MKTAAHKKLATGFVDTKPKVSIAWERDQFRRIQHLAKTNGVSFAKQVRALIDYAFSRAEGKP